MIRRLLLTAVAVVALVLTLAPAQAEPHPDWVGARGVWVCYDLSGQNGFSCPGFTGRIGFDTGPCPDGFCLNAPQKSIEQ